MPFPKFALFYFPDSDLLRVDLVVKRDAFKRGEDIWNKSTERGEETAAAVQLTRPSQRAAAAMGDQLKRDIQTLQRKHPTPLTSTQLSDDSDNTQIDLFDTTLERGARKRALISESEEEEGGNQENDDRSLLQKTPTPNVQVLLDEDVVSALKELPQIVASLKVILEAMKRGSSPSSNSSQSSSEQCITGWSESEMMVLADSDVTVPKRLFERLNKSRVSLFTQELAVLIFGKDTFAKSTLTGKSGMQNEKERLDPHKVNVLLDTVKQQFPNTTVSEVRALIRLKCNNECYSKN